MKTTPFVILLLFAPFVLMGQKVSSNEQLLEKIETKPLLDTASRLFQESIYPYKFDINDVHNLHVWILPKASFVRTSDFNFTKKLIDHIEFDENKPPDVFLYKEDLRNQIVATMYHSAGIYDISPPLFDEDKKMSKVRKNFALDDLLIFSLPWLDEWWAIKDRKLFVFNKRFSRLVDGDEYIRQRYKEEHFIDLMNGIIRTRGLDPALEVIKEMENGNEKN